VTKSGKNERLNPENEQLGSFEELLRRACDCEDEDMNVLGDPDYAAMLRRPEHRRWVKDLAERAHYKHTDLRVRDVLEGLYEAHNVPPAVPLGILSYCMYFDIRMGEHFLEKPPLLTDRKLREESAAAMEKVAADLEVIDGRIWTMSWGWLAPETRAQLRRCAANLRALGLTAQAHRPRVHKLDCAAMLTRAFQERTGKPLWDYTADLMAIASGRKVGDWKDSVKKAVKRRQPPAA
jgi:hypothetical protein